MTSVVDVRDLSFGFRAEDPVLRGITFDVAAGESVGIAGANGAGKSTLLWCLLGLYKPEGHVRLFGARPSRSSLARIGVVFQNPEDMLFMPRLVDDVALPLVNGGLDREAAFERAQSVLDSAGLGPYAGEPARHLSLGQRKRAAIAAALVRGPELLMLDEPTAELDPRAARLLAESLDTMCPSRIIASHDLGFLRRTTRRLLVLRRGSVLADGPTAGLLDDHRLLEAAELT
jgi:cobalt/nickel transport system ATP-binding protein